MSNLPEVTVAFSVSALKKGKFVKWIALKKIQQCGAWRISL